MMRPMRDYLREHRELIASSGRPPVNTKPRKLTLEDFLNAVRTLAFFQLWRCTISF